MTIYYNSFKGGGVKTYNLLNIAVLNRPLMDAFLKGPPGSFLRVEVLTSIDSEILIPK